MTRPKVTYRTISRYKYLVTERVRYSTGIKGRSARIFDKSGNLLVLLMTNGELVVHPGYAWDGPSGPTIDTPDWMDASLVHDIFYQMMREKKLPQKFRKPADKLMRRMCIEAGMSRFRANYSYLAVRWFGAFAASPRARR